MIVEVGDSGQLKVNGRVSLNQKLLPLPVVFSMGSANFGEFTGVKKSGVEHRQKI
jgi:hypothetical protein